MNIELEKYEIDVLSEWHREKQYESSRNEDYEDAAFYKKRHEELTRILKDAPNDRVEGRGCED